MIYPWQKADWSRITRNPGQTHHAWLLIGRSGIGKREFALKYAQYLVCQRTSSTQTLPCGDCQNCRLFEAGTHPDFHVITTEAEAVNGRSTLISQYSERYQDSRERDRKTKPGRIISIDQIRRLIDRFSTHTHISAVRVALILPADRMNINAANALLKLLEEPPSSTVFILVSAESGRLPSTIRSRCIGHNMMTPGEEAALSWLEQGSGKAQGRGQSRIALKSATGGPLDARVLIEEGLLELQKNHVKGLINLLLKRVPALELAGQTAKMDFEQALVWLQQFVVDLVKWHQIQLEPDWADVFPQDIQTVSIERLYRLYDRIIHYRRIARDPVNEQLVIEDLLLVLQRTVIR